MKAYTSLEQSKKLAEILPLESADMYFSKYDTIHAATLYSSCDSEYFKIHEYIPCWSLAALLDVLPSATLDSSDDHHFRLRCMEKFTEWHDNAIDTCVEMIEKLLKQMIYDFNNS